MNSEGKWEEKEVGEKGGICLIPGVQKERGAKNQKRERGGAKKHQGKRK